MLNCKRLRQLRRFNDLSLSELAEKVRYSSPNSIWKLEHGLTNVPFGVVEKIAAVLEVSIPELLVDETVAPSTKVKMEEES